MVSDKLILVLHDMAEGIVTELIALDPNLFELNYTTWKDTFDMDDPIDVNNFLDTIRMVAKKRIRDFILVHEQRFLMFPADVIQITYPKDSDDIPRARVLAPYV